MVKVVGVRSYIIVLIITVLHLRIVGANNGCWLTVGVVIGANGWWLVDWLNVGVVIGTNGIVVNWHVVVVVMCGLVD